MGDGSAPVYVNKLTGVKLGTIALGSAPAAGITSDEAGNILLSNHVDAGGEFSLWVTSSVTEEPVLFHTFANTTDLPMGRKIRVIGDVKSEAQIVATLEGIDGVTTSSKFWVLKVEGGKVVSAEVKDVAGTGLAWGSAPVNGTAICGASVNPADGWFGAAYDANVIHWLKADGTDGATAGTSDGNSWGWNCNNFDSKRFNNANYLTMFVVSHFPAWGIGPRLYLYDVTNPASLSGDFGDTGALVMSNTSIGWFQTGSYAIASGDVVLAPSADGFMLYVYYYDHNSQVLGGYSADCIKR
jgi:hypothetical protein